MKEGVQKRRSAPRIGLSALALAMALGGAVGPAEPGPLGGDESAAADPNAKVTVCGERTLRLVRSQATPKSPSVKIACSLTLRPEDVITKQLLITGQEASGVRIECNGATVTSRGTVNRGKASRGTVNRVEDTIVIRSRDVGSAWERPTDVSIRDCTVEGSIRVYGMATNGEGPDLRESSLTAGHTERARANAPTRIVLDNLTITAFRRTPVYFGPGVSHSRLTNSNLRGDVDDSAVAVYLDAESTANTIENNDIHVRTDNGREREQIAVDGSSHNRIVSNRFSALNHGGIYLYRNCGLGGTIRHATPSHNLIINNVFYYDEYEGPHPAVFLGARKGNEGYCDEDEDGDRLYGSSVSNQDFARHNVVMQNQIYKRSIPDMIRTGGTVNTPNYIAYNETVTAEIPRLAGCYVGQAHDTDFILHGETIEVRGEAYTCDAGHLQYAGPASRTAPATPPSSVPFR